VNVLVRFELNVAVAALRRIVAHPSRRVLWAVVVAFAVAAIAFDIATSDVASRDLGRWRPSAPMVAVVVAAVLAFAALVGARTPLTYGTRAADTVWWHYAGFETGVGQRATTAILTARATLFVALGAVPVGALLALAAPQRAGTIVALAAAAIALTPATVLVSSSFAPRRPDVVHDAPRDVAGAMVAHDISGAPAVRAVRGTIPHGVMAARWLVAARRGEMLVPYDRLAFGIVVGLAAPRVAAVAGGQLVAMAIVVGGLAVILDAAIRGTTAPATLRSPWWRAAVGTSPRGLAAWAFCDAAGAAAPLVGIAVGLGIALGQPLAALAVLPAIALVPAALRLVVLCGDTFFPAAADRRGAGAGLRAFVVFELTLDVFTLALAAGARGGAFASIAAATVALLAITAAAAWCSAARLPYGVG
jgi:hypothetical protein